MRLDPRLGTALDDLSDRETVDLRRLPEAHITGFRFRNLGIFGLTEQGMSVGK
jgi:hypothetical protein